MELLQLQYFVKVARTGNITQAARQLYVSQPSLSTTIARLESDIGVLLFERSANKITLTRAGETFLKYVESALSNLEIGAEEAKCVEGRDKKDICVASAFGITKHIVMDFGITDPSAKVTLLLDNNDEIRENVLSGKADFGISLGRIDDNRLESRLMMRGRCYAAVSVENKGIRGTHVRLSDLTWERIFCSRLGKTDQLIQTLFREQGLTCQIMPLDEKDVLFEAVEKNLGIVICMPMLYDKKLGFTHSANQTRFVLIEDARSTWDIHLVTKKEKYLAPRVQELIGATLRHFAENDRLLHELTVEIESALLS